MFSFLLAAGSFSFNGKRQERLQNGNVPVFGSIETLVLFSSVWYACVMARCRMMVWLIVWV